MTGIRLKQSLNMINGGPKGEGHGLPHTEIVRALLKTCTESLFQILIGVILREVELYNMVSTDAGFRIWGLTHD